MLRIAQILVLLMLLNLSGSNFLCVNATDIDVELKPAELTQQNHKMQINALVDTPYKLISHYVPALVPRVLTENKFLRRARKADVKRLVYLKAKAAGLEDGVHTQIPIEQFEATFEASKSGMLSRNVYGTGILNGFEFTYDSKLKYRITKTGTIETKSTLGGKPYIEVHVDSNGNNKTNKVKGTVLGRNLEYKTVWRSSEGMIGTFPYKIHVEGLRGKDHFAVKSYGSIGDYEISGFAKEVSKDNFEIEEEYGPLIIKTTVKIYD